MTADQNYHRMPGMGDLPGDASHPNSPDHVAAPFGEDDAAAAVAKRLHRHGDVGELVEDVANAAGLLDWIAHNAVLPEHLLWRFRSLEKHVKRLRKEVDREYDVLNGRAA